VVQILALKIHKATTAIRPALAPFSQAAAAVVRLLVVEQVNSSAMVRRAAAVKTIRSKRAARE
jgi:hypothetical protein